MYDPRANWNSPRQIFLDSPEKYHLIFSFIPKGNHSYCLAAPSYVFLKFPTLAFSGQVYFGAHCFRCTDIPRGPGVQPWLKGTLARAGDKPLRLPAWASRVGSFPWLRTEDHLAQRSQNSNQDHIVRSYRVPGGRGLLFCFDHFFCSSLSSPLALSTSPQDCPYCPLVPLLES